MLLSAVHICYDPSHKPFATEGAIKIEDLDPERPASKIIRAVIRDVGIDATSWESYSLHKCYCNSHTKTEDQHLEAFKSELNLEQLGIRNGDSVFIRKMVDRVYEMEGDQDSDSRRSSRKRKERTDDESLESQFQRISREASSNFMRIKTTSNPSNPHTSLVKVSSNFENLTSNAASAARSISALLGGEGWKRQPIGTLGPIQTSGKNSLQHLLRLIKTSLKIDQDSQPEPGLFNSDLVEALARAYHQRISSTMAKKGQSNFFDLRPLDYEQANELLKGKVEQDGSWEGSSLAHLDESALSKPAQRFPLSDSGLSGQFLSAARDICICWNNDKWMSQAPLPGLSPISLKDHTKNVILRQIAQLTRVKAGEATPDGFPPIVLRALRQAIQQRTDRSGSGSKESPYGWVQSKDIPQALKILKRDLKDHSTSSTSVNKRANKKAKTSLIWSYKVFEVGVPSSSSSIV